MQRKNSQRALARRALIEVDSERKSWIRHGAAGLAVAALGLAVAGSVALNGNAENRHDTTPAAVAPTSTGAVPKAFDQRGSGTSRDASRGPLTTPLANSSTASAPAAQQAAAARAQQQDAKSAGSSGVSTQAAERRTNALQADRSKADKLADSIADQRAEAKRTAARKAAVARVDNSRPNASADRSAVQSAQDDTSGKVSLPITTGYTVAARFGQVGAWARYHTGFDFACPIGTPIHAAASGVVTNAGPNGEAGWAGNYVTIKHSDGTQSLYAHMANVSVSVGQKVTGGQVIGHVGMTGRSFGPHVHFEVYPAGVTPGDVYKAVDPAPWLEALGLHP